MGIIALDAMTMVDDDQVPITSTRSSERHDTTSRGIHFAAILDSDIHTIMVFFTMYRTDTMAPRRIDLGTVYRPIERMVRCRGRSNKDILRRRLIRAGCLVRTGRSCRYGQDRTEELKEQTGKDKESFHKDHPFDGGAGGVGPVFPEGPAPPEGGSWGV